MSDKDKAANTGKPVVIYRDPQGLTEQEEIHLLAIIAAGILTRVNRSPSCLADEAAQILGCLKQKARQ